MFVKDTIMKLCIKIDQYCGGFTLETVVKG